MKKTTLILFIFIALIYTSCNSTSSNKYVNVESKSIPNFSNSISRDTINYTYFSNITRLPHGFTLGDYQDYNSIRHLTESANITPIEDKILKLFLTPQELEIAFDMFIDSSLTEPNIRKVQYYPYGRLVTDQYVLLILNKRNNFAEGRDYTFTIRTYDFEGNIISSLDFAKWDEVNKIFYEGMILPDMNIESRFKDSLKARHQILDNGVIE